MKAGLLAAGGVIGLALLVAQPARGQTPPGTATPSSVPTATPTVPSGQDLLDRAQAADAARNTVHVEGYRRELKPGKSRTVIRQRIDLARRGNRFHDVITTRAVALRGRFPAVTAGRLEIIMVGKRAAVRNGHDPWSCGQVTSGTVSVPATTQPAPQDLGSETVYGIPVWHVRTVRHDTAGGQTNDETRDDYISQIDDTTVRTVVSGTVTAHGSLVELIADRSDDSRYGLPVSIALPRTCKGTGPRLSLDPYLRRVSLP